MVIYPDFQLWGVQKEGGGTGLLVRKSFNLPTVLLLKSNCFETVRKLSN